MNLEQFPTSETAKKMLSYITGNGFYDNSYVGKWIFQVMGEEMGDARAIIDELPLQAFVETATWGLRYHEEKYGLPIRENLSPDERRKIILEKRDLKAPMSPWRMEKIISGILGCTVDVVDINEPGSKISHPNMFIVYLEGEGEFSLGKAVCFYIFSIRLFICMTMRMSCLDVMTAWEKVFSSVPRCQKIFATIICHTCITISMKSYLKKPFAEEKRN